MSDAGVGGRLPGGMERVLYARPYRHDSQARGADQERPAEADPEHDALVQADDRPRGRPSARRRRLPPEIPPRPPRAACRSNRASSSIRATGFEIVSKAWKYARFFLKTRKVLKAALEAPDRWTYSDLAIEPPQVDDEFEQLSLYHATSGGEAALARKALGDSIRDSAAAPRRGCDVRDSGGIISSAMIEAAQVRAARALIGWSQAKLAETSGVPVSKSMRSRPVRPVPSPRKRSTNCAPRSRPPASSSSPRMAAAASGSGCASPTRANISAGTTSTRQTTSRGPIISRTLGATPNLLPRFVEIQWVRAPFPSDPLSYPRTRGDSEAVMTGLVPVIHVVQRVESLQVRANATRFARKFFSRSRSRDRLRPLGQQAWMAGSSPAMTTKAVKRTYEPPPIRR